MSDEPDHRVTESNEKIRIKTQIKRGTATRDQDTHDLKVRAETPEAAAEDLDTLISELEDRDVFDRARDIQSDD